MGYGILTNTGALKKKFRPAVYFDSSVLIEYWMTEGMEIDLPDDAIEKKILEHESEEIKIMRSLLKSDNRLEKMIEIRKKLLFEEVKLTAVISPLSLLELMEWNAEVAFKWTATQAAGTQFIQRKGKKEIGDYLKKLLELRKHEIQRQRNKRRSYSTGLEIIMSETWLDRGFCDLHGLQGLLKADIINLDLTTDKVWQEPYTYAYLQLGVSDIMHILTAQHLRCDYLASFDSDFQRASDVIKEATGMTLLNSPEKILELL